MLAQMIVAAAVAEAELQHRALQAGDLRHRPVEAGALDRQAADHAVETAHAGFLSICRATCRDLAGRPGFPLSRE